MKVIKKDTHFFVPFEGKTALINTHNHVRIYATREKFERYRAVVAPDAELVEYGPIYTEPECHYCADEACPELNWQYGLDHILPGYKYCPMCGRRLEAQ